MPKPDSRPGLRQDPHRPAGRREKVLEVAIGRQLRDFRRNRKITVAALARQAGLSAGMLSKIENGQISPSLATLQTLSAALSVPITAFFAKFEEFRHAVHVKAGEAVEVERRGTRAGHQYNLLGHLGANASGVMVEPYLIVLSTEADVFPTFQHEGIELIYMLGGVLDYRHGDRLYRLEPGDSLFFDADPATACSSMPMPRTAPRA